MSGSHSEWRSLNSYPGPRVLLLQALTANYNSLRTNSVAEHLHKYKYKFGFVFVFIQIQIQIMLN